MSRTTLGGRGNQILVRPTFRAPGRAATVRKMVLVRGCRLGTPTEAALPADSRLRATVGARRPSWLVPRGGRPAGRPPRLPIPRGPRSAVRVLAGLSSAFNRPSVGRSAGRLNALPVLSAGCRRHPAFLLLWL